MTQKLVECIPNFSEARRPEVISAIRRAIAAVPFVQTLDQHSDLDHNRTVITFVGPPESVEEAAFQGIAQAAALIDLDQHSGEHPRIGASDKDDACQASSLHTAELTTTSTRWIRQSDVVSVSSM